MEQGDVPEQDVLMAPGGMRELRSKAALVCHRPPENGNGITFVAKDKCAGCPGQQCIFVCPAGLFEKVQGKVRFDYRGVCLECGACRLVCENIVFEYPEPGTGIAYRFG